MALKSDYAEVPVNTIYIDRSLNCRGIFTPQSCLDLADSIKQHGLQFPVVVQPLEDVEVEIPTYLRKDTHKYRLIAGHRRFTAISQLLGLDTIDANIRRGLTEKDVKVLNLIENLERKDINLLEEARALRAIFPEGTSYLTISKELSKSQKWVRLRCMLLDMPEEIQQSAANGKLTISDIDIICHTAKKITDKQKLALAREILLAKGLGLSLRKLQSKFLKRRFSRKRGDIHAMMARIMTEDIDASACRALAWAAGDLTDDEFLEEPK